ncbi:MAG TPA: ABC transporter substrate-binding protein [Candidatus Binatia bacterium]|jgi:ABC-type nitrate/sulfonate/bicarbonate transport system substrate-binding protein
MRRIVLRVLLLLIACVHSANAPAEPLRVPYVSISGFQAPLWLGERSGAFRRNQLDVQLIYMPGGSMIIQTLLSGEVGVASLAPPSAIAAWTKGAALVVVAGGIERALNVLMVSPKIKKPEDLKGKRIAISRFGSLSDVSLRDALAFYKLRPNQDVAIAQMGGLGERMLALTSGAVDAAILNVDQVYQAEKLGYEVLIDLRKLPLNYPTQGIVTSREFLRNQRSTVKRFLKVYIEGIKILKTDKALATDTLARYIKTNDREILSKTYDVYKEAWEPVPYVRREGIMQSLESIQDPAGKNAKPNLDTLIDNSLIQELEREGFIRELYPDGIKK